MKVAVVYIYPANAGPQFEELAMRFIQSYNQHPPSMEHDTIVVLNDAKATPETICLFASLPNVTFLERNNAGQDIGGYQAAAEKFPCDLMVFFGASAYLRGQGWLIRMVNAYLRHGPGAYGAHGHRGDDRERVFPHLRTTGWWTTPDLMNRYPMRVTKNEQRYPFEHGPNCFCNWVKAQKLPVLVVTWTGEYKWEDWDRFPNGFHRGDQSALLCGDRLTCPPYHPYA